MTRLRRPSVLPAVAVLAVALSTFFHNGVQKATPPWSFEDAILRVGELETQLSSYTVGQKDVRRDSKLYISGTLHNTRSAYPVDSTDPHMSCGGVPRPDFPRTLAEFQRRFASEETCRAYVAAARWPGGYRCPRCSHREALDLPGPRRKDFLTS